MNADDRDLIDFGITKIGVWDEKGMLTEVVMDYSILADDLPRWMLKEPIMTLSCESSYCVYLRGLYSEKLTKARKAAIFGY